MGNADTGLGAGGTLALPPAADTGGGSSRLETFDNSSVGEPFVPASSDTPLTTGPSTRSGDCDPGAYVGTYDCKLVMQGMETETKIEGIVAFDLEVNESTVEGECELGQEFCDFDLVIAEGTGELFGFVLGIIGFETGLAGGLDCTTGEFHAEAVGGIYGIPWPDPDDPEGRLKVTAQLGTFDGTLDGLHDQDASPQTINGDWNLGEPALDIYCPGPFATTWQPK